MDPLIYSLLATTIFEAVAIFALFMSLRESRKAQSNSWGYAQKAMRSEQDNRYRLWDVESSLDTLVEDAEQLSRQIAAVKEQAKKATEEG